MRLFFSANNCILANNHKDQEGNDTSCRLMSIGERVSPFTIFEISDKLKTKEFHHVQQGE
jgi:hypothetical protein